MRCYPSYVGIYHKLVFWGTEWMEHVGYAAIFSCCGGEKGMAFESLLVYLSPFTTNYERLWVAGITNLRLTLAQMEAKLVNSWANFTKCGTRPRDIVALNPHAPHWLVFGLGDDHPTFLPAVGCERLFLALLGGVFKYLLFSPLLGEDSHSDKYFSNGLKPPTRLLCWKNQLTLTFS